MDTVYIPKIITLLAGAVICIVCIVKGTETTTALEMLLATLIIFFIIGNIAKVIVDRVNLSNSVMRKKSELYGDENIDDGSSEDDVLEEKETEESSEDE